MRGQPRTRQHDASDYFDDFALEIEDLPGMRGANPMGPRWQLPVAIGAVLALLAVGAYAVLTQRQGGSRPPTSAASSPDEPADGPATPAALTPAGKPAGGGSHRGLSFWTIQISKDGQHMTVYSAGLPARPAGYRYELWAWPPQGQPVSLVPLPVAGEAVYDLDPSMVDALQRSGRVAVTVESAGPRKGPPKVILTAPLKSSIARL